MSYKDELLFILFFFLVHTDITGTGVPPVKDVKKENPASATHFFPPWNFSSHHTDKVFCNMCIFLLDLKAHTKTEH